MNKVTVEGSHYPHAELISVAQVSLEFAKEKKTGLLAYANFMASIIYLAFSLEAYLNYLGSIYFSDWEEIEKILRPDEKLDKVAEHFNHTIDRSRRPFQSFREIFKFRNNLAHARVKNLREVKISTDSLYISTEIESIIASEKPQQFYDDTVEMIKKLHYEMAGFSKDHDPFVVGETKIV
jgi:hypothetical protein